MALYNKQDSFNAGVQSAHAGFNSSNPSCYDKVSFLKGWKSVDRNYKITDFESIEFIGTFSQCCEYFKNKDYLKGYVIVSYNF